MKKKEGEMEGEEGGGRRGREEGTDLNVFTEFGVHLVIEGGQGDGTPCEHSTIGSKDGDGYGRTAYHRTP